MAIITQDVQTVFFGYENQNEDSLFGLLADGVVSKLFDSGDLLPGAAIAGSERIVVNTAVRVGADLYFARSYSVADAQSEHGVRYDMQIIQMSSDGTVEVIAALQNTSIANYVISPTSATAIDLNGTYCLSLKRGSFVNGVLTYSESELYTVAADSTVTQISHVERPDYYGTTHGIAAVGATTFFVADRQTPMNVDELWRIAPDGANRLVFSNGTSSVRDVLSFVSLSDSG